MSILSTYPPMRGLANVPWYFGLGNATLSSSSQITGTTTLTASSTIHTKGAWAQIVASTAEETVLLCVNAHNVGVSNTETSTLLDFATGAAGSEVAFASNIAVGGALTAGQYDRATVILLPVRIPAASRLSARIQSITSSKTAVVSCNLYTFGFGGLVPTSLDVLGTSTADSRGTVMSGASGTWVEVVASTSQRYRALCIVPSVPTNNVTTERVITFTAGFGAAGSEVALGSTVARFETLERVATLPAAPPLPIFVDVPAGSRLAIRHNAPSQPGEFAACLIGVP